MGVNLSAYKPLFIQTATALAHQYEESLVSLRQNLADREAFDELYRSIHSLKGQSLFMGYTNMGNLCVQLEKHLSPYRDQFADMTDDTIATMPGKDILLKNLDSIEKTGTEISFEDAALSIPDIQT